MKIWGVIYADHRDDCRPRDKVGADFIPCRDEADAIRKLNEILRDEMTTWVDTGNGEETPPPRRSARIHGRRRWVLQEREVRLGGLRRPPGDGQGDVHRNEGRGEAMSREVVIPLELAELISEEMLWTYRWRYPDEIARFRRAIREAKGE